MSNFSDHPGFIYPGIQGHNLDQHYLQNLGQEIQPNSSSPSSASPETSSSPMLPEDKKDAEKIVKKDIVIPETWANKAIKTAISGTTAIALGYLIERIVKNKPITWFLIGSSLFIGSEFYRGNNGQKNI